MLLLAKRLCCNEWSEYLTSTMTLHKFLKFQNIHIYFPKFKQLLHFMTCSNGMTLRLSVSKCISQCKSYQSWYKASFFVIFIALL